jgi:hypothetical protein
MKSFRTAIASQNGTLAARPPKAVKVRSAEGYVRRLPGVVRRSVPRITDAQIDGIVRDFDARARE